VIAPVPFRATTLPGLVRRKVFPVTIPAAEPAPIWRSPRTKKLSETRNSAVGSEGGVRRSAFASKWRFSL
jgi:hypothetical protein